MIIPFAILTYKLFKRFPLLVLSLFVFHFVNTITIDKETEQNETEIEYLSAHHANHEVEYIDPTIEEKVTTESPVINKNTAFQTSSYKHQIHNKLYILYSKLLIDRDSLNTSQLNKISIRNFKYYNHGSYKENNYYKAFNHRCSLFCNHVNYNICDYSPINTWIYENDKQNNRRKSNTNSKHLLCCDSGHFNNQSITKLNSSNHEKYKAINCLEAYNNSKCLLYYS